MSFKGHHSFKRQGSSRSRSFSAVSDDIDMIYADLNKLKGTDTPRIESLRLKDRIMALSGGFYDTKDTEDVETASTWSSQKASPVPSVLSMRTDRSIEKPVNFSDGENRAFGSALSYAGPGDVACDMCAERKLKAVKSCLTCSAAFCESHARQHYTDEVLQRHPLVTLNLDLHQENAELRQQIRLLSQMLEVSPSPGPMFGSRFFDQPFYPIEMDNLETASSWSGRSASPVPSLMSEVSDRSIEKPVNFSDGENQAFSPTLTYAGPEDVACDLCSDRKLKAVKSCKTCMASFCESHIRQHYTDKALRKHDLVEAIPKSTILQENAGLKKAILMLRNENANLKQKITELTSNTSKPKIPEYINKGKNATAADVTVDRTSAHCALIISDDGKKVRYRGKKVVSDNPERFDKWACVLGGQGFSSGRHFWHVEVNKEFTIGVATENAPRRGKFTFSPKEGYYCLYHYWVSFSALTDGVTPLQETSLPRVMGVCVDVDERWVFFYNAETKAKIFQFSDMDISPGVKIYPLFNTLDKQADLVIKTPL